MLRRAWPRDGLSVDAKGKLSKASTCGPALPDNMLSHGYTYCPTTRKVELDRSVRLHKVSTRFRSVALRICSLNRINVPRRETDQSVGLAFS